jgi:hypothetical protein
LLPGTAAKISQTSRGDGRATSRLRLSRPLGGSKAVTQSYHRRCRHGSQRRCGLASFLLMARIARGLVPNGLTHARGSLVRFGAFVVSRLVRLRYGRSGFGLGAPLSAAFRNARGRPPVCSGLLACDAGPFPDLSSLRHHTAWFWRGHRHLGRAVFGANTMGLLSARVAAVVRVCTPIESDAALPTDAFLSDHDGIVQLTVTAD